MVSRRERAQSQTRRQIAAPPATGHCRPTQLDSVPMIRAPRAGAAAVDHAVEAHHPAAQPGIDGVLQQGLLPRPDDDHGEPGDRQAGERQPEDVGGGEADQHRREERDAGNRRRGQTGDGAALGEPEPAQHGAQTGRGSEPGEPLGAAPEHRVGEAGEELHEGARADRDDGQDDQHRPDPLWRAA